MFTPGQPLDVQELNKLKSFPKTCEIYFGASLPSGGSQHVSSGAVPIQQITDPAMVSNNANTFTLQPGRYHLDIPIKSYKTNTQYVYLYNQTTTTELVRTYAHPGSGDTSMDNAIIRYSLDIDQTSQLYVATTAGKVYPTIGTITMFEEY